MRHAIPRRPGLSAWLLLLSVLGCAGAGGFDPASQDRSDFDSRNPPLIFETIFEVDGSGLNAIVYEAQGAGPHPTAILLHGFPGNERNLDLAQAMRRAGWNVVFFHYRGTWGSGGEFSFLHVLDDVAGVVKAISDPGFASAHRIDPDRIALVGHSMGGFAALVAGSEIEAVDCIVSMAGANLGGLARATRQSPEASAAFGESLDGWSGPIRGPGGQALIDEIAANTDRFDSTQHAAELVRRDLLLIAGERDEVTPLALHHTPLVEALRALGESPAVASPAGSLEVEVYSEGDHSFSGQRIALARRVTSWLTTRCATARARASGMP